MGAIEVTRVVIDTNVLVSGLLFGGIPEKLVRLLKAGRVRPIMFSFYYFLYNIIELLCLI